MGEIVELVGTTLTETGGGYLKITFNVPPFYNEVIEKTISTECIYGRDENELFKRIKARFPMLKINKYGFFSQFK